MSRVVALLWVLAGCAKTEDVYEITAALESNSCGSNALPLPDGTSYRTQLKPDPPKASWKVLPKGAPITGSYNADDGKFHFSIAQTLYLDGMDAGAALRCSVIRQETLTGTLEPESDAGVDAGYPLHGEHVIGFTADSNGSCRGVTGPLGPFDRLPCEAKYAIVGEAKEDR